MPCPKTSRWRRFAAVLAAVVLALSLASAASAQPKMDVDRGYNSEYIFGMSKGIAASTLHPAAKPLCFLVTVPLDLVTLPFTLVGGLFG
jgi:hypothetical protein